QAEDGIRDRNVTGVQTCALPILEVCAICDSDLVGMNHRFRSDVQAVRGFLAGGDIGMLQAIRCGWYTFQPSRNLVAWRLRRQEAGGGAFLDLGLQLLDLGLWLAAWPAAKRIAAHTM